MRPESLPPPHHPVVHAELAVGRRHRRLVIAAASALGVLLFAGGALLGALIDDGTERPEAATPTTATTAPDRVATTSATPPSDPTVTATTGPVEPFPPLALAEAPFDWQAVELELPAGAESWLQQVLATNDGFVAVASGWDPTLEVSRIALWRSTDGRAWERIEPTGDVPTDTGSLAVTHLGLVAGGQLWDEQGGRSRPVVWLSADGRHWKRSELGLELERDEDAWISAVLDGGDRILVLVNRSRAGRPLPVRVEQDGRVLELNEEAWAYAITDAATGRLLLWGSQSQIWETDSGEPCVYDQATGAELVCIPWDVYEEALASAREGWSWTPGSAPPPAVIDLEGVRVTIDEDSYRFAATSLSTGDVLAEGPMDHLWRAPYVEFTDPATAELVLRVATADIEAAQQAAWAGAEGSEEPFVLTSADGETWTAHAVQLEPGSHLAQIVWGPSGYVAFGELSTGESAGGSRVWLSEDGVTWVQSPATGLTGWLSSLTSSPDGYYAVGVGDAPRVWHSADGTAWAEILDRDQIGWTGGSVWLERVATGPFGIVVTGSRDNQTGPEPWSITVDGVTLVVDSTSYTLTDDVTASVLFSAVYDSYTGEPEGVHWDEHGLWIEGSEGQVLFAASHEQIEETRTGNEELPSYRSEPLLLSSPDGNEWFWAAAVGAEPGWLAGVAVGADAVVAGLNAETGCPASECGEDEYRAPTPKLWIGVPGG